MAFLPKLRFGALSRRPLPAVCAAGLLRRRACAQESPCAECHDDVHLDATPHAELACLDCHPGFDADPHPEALPAKPYAVCADCHDAGEKLAASVHGGAGKAAPSCRECHGAGHKILPVEGCRLARGPGARHGDLRAVPPGGGEDGGARRPRRPAGRHAPTRPASTATARRTRSPRPASTAKALASCSTCHADGRDRAAREPPRQGGGARRRARPDLHHLPRRPRHPLAQGRRSRRSR